MGTLGMGGFGRVELVSGGRDGKGWEGEGGEGSICSKQL